MTGKIHLGDSKVVKLNQMMRRIPKSLNTMKLLPANKASIWLYEGIYYKLMGKYKKTVAAWTKSMEYAQRFNQPYELARASYELGQHLHTDVASRREYLVRAYTIFGRLGTPYEWELAKSALEGLTNGSMD